MDAAPLNCVGVQGIHPVDGAPPARRRWRVEGTRPRVHSIRLCHLLMSYNIIKFKAARFVTLKLSLVSSRPHGRRWQALSEWEGPLGWPVHRAKICATSSWSLDGKYSGVTTGGMDWMTM